MRQVTEWMLLQLLSDDNSDYVHKTSTPQAPEYLAIDQLLSFRNKHNASAFLPQHSLTSRFKTQKVSIFDELIEQHTKLEKV